MAKYLVTLRYVPADGSPPVPDGELRRVAVSIEGLLAAHKCSAHPANEDLLVTIEAEAGDADAASSYGLDLSWAGVIGSGLRTYRLDQTDVRLEQ